MGNKKLIYRINFLCSESNATYQIYAKSVSESNLWGFIEVEDIIFKKESSLLVDTLEEKLRNEFKDVERFYIPIHAVLRIDEVKEEGNFKVIKTNVRSFPVYSPPPNKKKS